MKTLRILIVVFVATLFVACSNKNEINLAGEWQVELRESAKRDTLLKPNRGLGPTQNVMYQPTVLNASAKTKGTIVLPATLDEYEFGNRVEEPFLGCLSRKYQFIGEAVYSRKIKTSQAASWKITLERVLWKSTLRIDGETIDSCESLATPHCFFVENLPAGEHTLEIVVDNTMIHRIGEKGHAYGEHMQTIWNGILGKMLMTKVVAPTLDDVRIRAPFERNRVDVAFVCSDDLDKLHLTLRNAKNDELLVNKQVEVVKNGNEQLVSLPLEAEKFEAWSEFNPQLYTLELRMNDCVLLQKNIGFRSFRREGNQLYMNGEPLFLRGNLDNCHFPLTGYPSMTKEDWRRIFEVQKNYGCNNIRFHSYCPPEAAFEAADELGLYLAPEAGIWIDGWMPGQLTPLGKGDSLLDNFVKSELKNICKSYGTHASFAMLGIGNELGSSDYDSLQTWVGDLKAAEEFSENDGWQTRLYTISTARTLTAVDDFYVTHHYPNVGGVRQWMFPRTNWNYEELYAQTTTPTVAHEIGQWPVYPDWREITKYTGVLSAENLKALKAEAAENGVLQFNEAYHFASGMQSRLMYKDEIESFMRTPSCRGIHLLGMQDYSGQGEALIGFLDSFYEPKGFWSVKEARGCFAPIVTLAEFEKYGWWTSETFTAKLLVRNQKSDLEAAQIHYKIHDSKGAEVLSGATPAQAMTNGALVDCGTIALDLQRFANEKLTLTTVLTSGDAELSEPNSWSFWVFAEQTQQQPENCLLTDDLSQAIEALNAGKRVLLDASQLGNEARYLKGDWGSVYWSTTWFPGQQMQTLGVWMERTHKAFEPFHSEGFADWIWWKIFENGRCFDLRGLTSDYRPMAMPVPDFHCNRPLGSIFEVRLGEGKLLVSGYALSGKTAEQIAYRNALIAYVESNDFAPQESVSVQWLNAVFNPEAQATNAALPAAYSNALLYVECGAKATAASAWTAEADNVFADERVSYEARNCSIAQRRGTWVWTFALDNEIVIKTPAGELGALHLEFADKGVSGIIEGRTFVADKQKIALPIDREDCLDGKLVLTLDDESALKTLAFVPVNK